MMRMEKEDVGLTLSLGFAQNQLPLQLNLKPTSSPVSNLLQFPWNQTFVSSAEHGNAEYLGGIDVNRAPSRGDCEEEVGVSSPKSTISSSISGKRSEREGNEQETTAERASSRGSSDEEEDGGETSRKKLRLSKDQSAVLEETFKDHNTLNPKQKLALAKRLGLTPRQVEVWFQNRRARTKLKQTEVDCEYLRRCVDNLTDENRRLEKEVAELRALKLSPQLYAHMTPPTTLIMCPSCERVGGSSLSSNVTNHMVRPHHRPVPVNPWLPAPTSMPRGPTLEVLRPRS